jgi:hypothetical protein
MSHIQKTSIAKYKKQAHVYVENSLFEPLNKI